MGEQVKQGRGLNSQAMQEEATRVPGPHRDAVRPGAAMSMRSRLTLNPPRRSSGSRAILWSMRGFEPDRAAP